jgi:hypothetical protein
LTASARSQEIAEAPWLGAQWADLESVGSDHYDEPDVRAVPANQ